MPPRHRSTCTSREYVGSGVPVLAIKNVGRLAAAMHPPMKLTFCGGTGGVRQWPLLGKKG